MKAIWNGTVLAESDDTVVVEGNHYFPTTAIRSEFFKPSSTHTVCGWKGTASYYTVEVDGKQNPDAAWYYPDPKDAAKNIAGYIAFWKGVKVEAMTDALFQLDGVTKRYEGRPALGPITLAIPAGQTTVLIGPSGCGKSTLLRLLIGLVVPDRGTVTFNGTVVSPASARSVRLRTGYVIQDGGLFPHLTARGNVALLARHLGWEATRINSRVTELAELTRFPVDGLDRYPQHLSGGQRQRVGLMRALMLNPDSLLLDEPLGALDPLVRADLQTELRDIFRTLGKTVVLVTHDLGEAAYFADRVVLLKDGRIVQDGRVADLWHRPADPFVTRFVQAQRGPQISAETT